MARRFTLMVILCSMSISSLAQTAEPADGLLRAASTGDPLALATAAAVAGDDHIIAALAADQSVMTRFAAVLATPWMGAPELAVDLLSMTAVSRDPDLAPAAAWALLRCAQSLALREPNPEHVGLPPEVIRRVGERSSDVSLRPDIARLIQISHALLEGPGEADPD